MKSWLAPGANAIGVDFGTDAVRMSQVKLVGDEYRLIAAASIDVPAHLRGSLAARIGWFTEAAVELLAQGKFRGRHAVLALPASALHLQHVRLPKTDDITLAKTLPFELRGKIAIDPSQCLLRHLIAGDVFGEQEPKSEVVVLAAAKEMVNQFLDAAARARLDVAGVSVEPAALIDCLAHCFRRKSDRTSVQCVVDIGATGARAYVIHSGRLVFARAIAVGGDHFSRAVAAEMKVSFEQARLLRSQCAAAPLAPRDEARIELPGRSTTDPHSPPLPVHVAAVPFDDNARVERACQEPLQKLIDELNLCRRYYESTFPNQPLDRLVFVGGEARQRWLCQQIARQMQLAAQVADPLARLSRLNEAETEILIDRRQPQPGWAIALGLTLGSTLESNQQIVPRIERRGAA